MTTVKGSKEYQWRVVKSHPRLQWWLGLAVAVVFILSIQAAYWFGQGGAAQGHEQAIANLKSVSTELDHSRKAEQELRREIEKARLGTDIDRQSLEEIRRELLELKSEMAALDEENQFYRNLMAPAGNKRGLNFGAVEIADTDRARTYRYKVVMQQLATQHELLKGTLNFHIVGRQSGAIKVLALHEVSKDVDSTNIKLRFKYFQNIEGQLMLPEGFEPERIELEARSTGQNATTIDKRFAWLVQESTVVGTP